VGEDFFELWQIKDVVSIGLGLSVHFLHQCHLIGLHVLLAETLWLF